MADEQAREDVRLPGPEDSRPALAAARDGGLDGVDVRLPGPGRWNAAEVVLAVLAPFLWPTLVWVALLTAGFYARLYGPDVVALAEDKHTDPAARQLAQTRLGLWAVCLAFPLQLVTVLVLLTRLTGTAPADLGVTGRRLGRNL